ncbi:MAG: hypothetical protein KDB71_01315 [Mycobacterium sp.]|nr:hypothetical protein [Mycobacterium sp.]
MPAHASQPGSPTGAVLGEGAYTGRMPSRSGDMVESHGTAPVPAANRYGTARRFFTVWFAPQVNVNFLVAAAMYGGFRILHGR